MFIDTHIHLDDKKYADDLSEVLERAKVVGLKAAVISGATPSDLPRAQNLCKQYDELYFTVGVHPVEAHQFDLGFLQPFLTHEKCKGIGEIGLDYYHLPEIGVQDYKQHQKDVFKQQLELAIEHNMVVNIHIREANEDSFAILDEYKSQLKGVLLHCFNASELLLEFKQQDHFYFGIGGIVTFKNAKQLQATISKIGLDKIVIETDGPYLSPHPNRGKRNEMAYLPLVLDKIADLLELDRKLVEDKIYQNTIDLLGDF